MKKLIVKIEKELLQITLVEKTSAELLISMSNSFDLPDYLKKDIQSQPEALSDFINNCLENSNFQVRDVVLLFDNSLGFFKEYRFKKSDEAIQDKLFHIEDDNILNSKGGRNISQRLNYNSQEEASMDKAAIYGIDDFFLRELVKALKKNNINTIYATSSLVTYKKTIAGLVDMLDFELEEFDIVIGLDIRDDSFRSVVINNGRLDHMEEFILSKDARPEDKNMTDMLTGLLEQYSSEDKSKTCAIISGGVDSKAEAKRLMSYSDVTCKSILAYYEKIRDTFELVQELEKKDEFFPEVFAICGIDIKKDKDESYLYGGWSRRKFSKATSKLAIAVTVIIAVLFSMLPIYNIYMIEKNKDYTAEIEKSKYNESLASLNQYRDVLSELKGYKDDEASIDGMSEKYSDVLNKLREEVLSSATINDLFFDEESGLIIDFDTTNVAAYEKARDKINEERELLIVETSAVDAESGGGKNYQIKVTINK